MRTRIPYIHRQPNEDAFEVREPGLKCLSAPSVVSFSQGNDDDYRANGQDRPDRSRDEPTARKRRSWFHQLVHLLTNTGLQLCSCSSECKMGRRAEPKPHEILI